MNIWIDAQLPPTLANWVINTFSRETVDRISHAKPYPTVPRYQQLPC